MKTWLMRTAMMAVFGAMLLAACGDDDDAQESTGTKPSGPAAAPGEKICTKDVCKLPEELKGEELCCMDPFTGGCGIMAAGTCRSFPKVDTRCPPPDIDFPAPPGFDARVFGCCTTDNQCGIDFGMMGCRPRTIGCMFLTKDQVSTIKPQTCDGDEMPLPEDCGTDRPLTFPTAGSGSGM